MNIGPIPLPDGGNTFRTGRLLPHPPQRVYEAFSRPEELARWWGPAGFRNTFQVFEFRAGGSWKFVMHGPDGKDYANESVFQTLEPARKVVIRHVCQPLFTLTVELEARDSGTALHWAQALDDPAVAAAVRHIVEPANEQNLDRLAALLASAPA